MGVTKTYYRYVNIYFDDENEDEARREIEGYLSKGYEVVTDVDSAEMVGDKWCAQLMKTNLGKKYKRAVDNFC